MCYVYIIHAIRALDGVHQHLNGLLVAVGGQLWRGVPHWQAAVLAHHGDVRETPMTGAGLVLVSHSVVCQVLRKFQVSFKGFSRIFQRSFKNVISI